MELFVLVMFWLYVLKFVIRIFFLVGASYPREDTRSLGMDAATAIIALPFMAWCVYLLWLV